jgi:predicted permease
MLAKVPPLLYATKIIKNKQSLKNVLQAFSMELPIYAVVVLAYVLFVLHFLGGWLFQLFRDERKLYAAVALGLIIGQGLTLEILARSLLGLIKGKREK